MSHLVISRTPLRISFAGGGSDLSSYYRENLGCVVSVPIKKYIYITLNKRFDDSLSCIKYSKTEFVERPIEIQHPIIREIFMKYDLNGLDFNSIADIPGGTGLGSSSCFTVGLLNTIHAIRNSNISKNELAAEACEIEIERLKEPIGKQDQYGAAVGGFKKISFNQNGSVDIQKISINNDAKNKLEKSLILLYLGGERKASEILSKQNRSFHERKDSVKIMRKMVDIAQELADKLSDNIESLGHYLHESWLLKRELSDGITNEYIDSTYKDCLKFGATGGKLLGAGGNGFLLLFVPENHMEMFKNKFQAFRLVNVEFDDLGTEIIYNGT